MTATEVLERVAELLGPNGEHWTQGENARTETGSPVSAGSANAVKWCLLGACTRQSHGVGFAAARLIRQAILPQRGSLVTFNDSHEWPEVKAALHKAIELSGRLTAP